jgi:Nif-specific regulatory protein
MPKLIICKGSRPHKEVRFSNITTIGRDTSNDIALRSKEVSNFHASIIQDEEGNYILYDQSSRNYTRMGGERIHHCRLSHGATFEIADYLITFLEEPETEESEQKLRVTRRIPIKEKWGKDANKTVFSVTSEIGREPKAYHDPQKRLSLILSISSEIVSILDYHELMEKALDISMEMMDAQRGFLALKNDQGDLIYSSLKGFTTEGGNLRVSKTMIHSVIKDGRSILTSNAVLEEPYKETKSILAYQLKSVMCVPLTIRGEVMGLIYLDNPEKAARFTPDDLDFLTILAHHIAIAIENARLHKKVQEERAALKNRLNLKEGVVFKSEKMFELYQNVRKVSNSSLPVLILGETGSGKELVARTIHNLSNREGRLIPINCSAIPENLLESELFGYEKGAYTGAYTAKPGLFELACGGSIFLDEIGDMSPTLQPKLLRVLQEKKITRLGGTKPKKIDARIIAATNQPLKDMVKKGVFRSDLYYRLAGVTLTVPPLRERKEDILPLANYLLFKFSQEGNRTLPRISHKVTKMLMTYHWPGNINELKTAIQSASVLGNGTTINPEDLPDELQETSIENFSTLEEIEQHHIRKALRHAKGNKRKAAQLLNIARDTMYKKIEKYGIEV